MYELTNKNRVTLKNPPNEQTGVCKPRSCGEIFVCWLFAEFARCLLDVCGMKIQKAFACLDSCAKFAHLLKILMRAA